MFFLYSLIVVTILALLFTKSIRNHPKIFYSIASVITILTVICETFGLTSGFKLHGFISKLEIASMKGVIAVACFVLVMFAGALNPRWNITKKLLSIRAELAIAGCILILPHCIVYFIMIIILSSGPLSSLFLACIIIGIIAFVIMLPLFVTSFKKIRIKMKYTNWKNLQRFAYLFYLLIYAHILILILNKPHINYTKLIIYTVVFGAYLILKLIKTFTYKYKFQR